MMWTSFWLYQNRWPWMTLSLYSDIAAVQDHPRSSTLVPNANRRRTCNFINSNFSYRIRDIDAHSRKLLVSPRHPCLTPRSWGTCQNFRIKLTPQKLEMGLLYGDNGMILTLTVFDWSKFHMCDWWTDRRTDDEVYAVAHRKSFYDIERMSYRTDFAVLQFSDSYVITHKVLLANLNTVPKHNSVYK